VTCSEFPEPAITVSAIEDNGTSASVIARADTDDLENAANSGFSVLAQNPVDPDMIVSSTISIEDID